PPYSASRRVAAEMRHLAQDELAVVAVAPHEHVGRAVLQHPPRLESTTMRSKLRNVERRCAIAMTVRPRIRRATAARIASSDSVSSAAVVSSSSRSGASLRNARAIVKLG